MSSPSPSSSSATPPPPPPLTTVLPRPPACGTAPAQRIAVLVHGPSFRVVGLATGAVIATPVLQRTPPVLPRPPGRPAAHGEPSRSRSESDSLGDTDSGSDEPPTDDADDGDADDGAAGPPLRLPDTGGGNPSIAWKQKQRDKVRQVVLQQMRRGEAKRPAAGGRPRPSAPELVDNRIVVAAFSADGTRFAVARDDKSVHVFSADRWICEAAWCIRKRPMALTFCRGSTELVVADKVGDVRRFVCARDDSGAVEWRRTRGAGRSDAILGHTSIITCISVSPADNRIITADRDEKIRVSCYPAAHCIVTYCLGHTECVLSALVLPWDDRLLVSAAGDGTVRLWRYETGQELARLSLGPVDAGAVAASGPPARRTALPPMVYGLACDRAHAVVAALVDQDAVIYILLAAGDGDGDAHRLTLIHTLPIEDVDGHRCVPQSAAFDGDGRLWAAVDSMREPLAVFARTAHGGYARVRTSAALGVPDGSFEALLDRALFVGSPARPAWRPGHGAPCPQLTRGLCADGITERRPPLEHLRKVSMMAATLYEARKQEREMARQQRRAAAVPGASDTAAVAKRLHHDAATAAAAQPGPAP